MTDASYRRLKLFSVVDRLGEIVCELRNFPPESDYGFFVRDVLVAWARGRGLLAIENADWAGNQLPFLRAFDLAYRERRVRFTIRRLNELYGRSDPSRLVLDKLKTDLYACVWTLSSIAADARRRPEASTLEQLFSRESVQAHLTMRGTPDESIDAFLARYGGDLDTVYDGLKQFLSGELEGFTRKVYARLLHHTRTEWPPEARRRLLRAFVAFPVYDAMLFPIRALSELGELDRTEVIRLSPLDATLLPVPGAANEPPTVADKLKGVAVHHFGAFFGRSKRENDYLWGRLDAVERLIWLVVGDRPSAAYRRGFKAVLEDERSSLTAVGGLIDALAERVDALPEALISPVGASGEVS